MTYSLNYDLDHKPSSSLQIRRYFGERVLGIFSLKTMAAILEFYNSVKLGRERNLY